MRTLQSARQGVAQGRAKSVVVFVHGYGADGADLLGLADPLAPHLPDTAFYAPDAPEPCSGNPFGRQWFSIPWLDGSSEADSRAGLLRAAEDLNGYLDAIMADEGVGPEALALVGFSQGAMMSLHIAPRRTRPVAGVVAISGRLLVPDLLGSEAVVKPPVLLIHGDEDPVVPFADMSLAGNALIGAGFEVFGHVMQGTGHGIAPDGLGVALQFLRERLPT
ncbi:MAG: alpha/beta fold hydrolase [Pseudotabrizicola sp.]|uniref:alpha/beta hydrolase n=1 Tax=Pseudotabrizicola sp. TaxID=2939647 RepID=UPI002715CB07|nr:alpha/beta fold hydrolase [Pseudotabrizicola sp.]MDO8884493.1 alpha/beta fold hydrolase [Pseudotabrizicola sp.]MDP2082689.1 alpha/beta fold hydrolase [Pseudotabrizicola sp.]MDZ7573585.1 alpha/beta fold hydrolase [Pseudotabrizicola sp.]